MKLAKRAVAAAMTVLLLAGCGGGDKKAEETPTPNQLQRLELTAEECAYLEELYTPHALVGIMAQNTGKCR